MAYPLSQFKYLSRLGQMLVLDSRQFADIMDSSIQLLFKGRSRLQNSRL